MVELLNFLNLPILGGVVYIIFRAGKADQRIEEHERRLGAVEDHAWGGRRSTVRNTG